MNKKYLFFLVGLIIIFASCQKGLEKNMSKDMVGTWYVIDANYTGGGSLLVEYFQDKVTFYADGRVVYYDAKDGPYSGTWSINSEQRTKETGSSSNSYDEDDWAEAVGDLIMTAANTYRVYFIDLDLKDSDGIPKPMFWCRDANVGAYEIDVMHRSDAGKHVKLRIEKR